MISLRLEFDTREVDRMTTRLAGSLSDFSPEMKQVGIQMARATDLRFKRADFRPLSPSTVKARRRKAARTGKQPVAGFETPLRETDEMRRSLVDMNAPHAASFTDKTRSVQGTSVPQARRIQEGGQGPARVFLTISDYEADAYTNILAAGIKRRVVQVSRGVR